MKIDCVTAWTLNVPLRQRFTSSFGSKAGTTRTIVQVKTDDGLEGWGETTGGQAVGNLIARLRSRVIGMDPFHLEALQKHLKMVPFFYGYYGYAAVAGIEVACWDVIGKATNSPLGSLIGGCVRESVPATGLVTRGDELASQDIAHLTAEISDEAAGIVDEYGFDVIKLKGTSDSVGDYEILKGLRLCLPLIGLRVDPNAAWTVHETLSAGSRLEDLGLEYLEDPCGGLEAMRRVRERVRIPLCTNMCVTRFEDIGPAVRMDAVDVIHGDVAKWGGILATKALAKHCETFGLGMNMHSGGELGVSTAVHLAVAGSTPQVGHAIDSMYYLLEDDIIAEPFDVSCGGFAVPTGRPGIGVEIDEDKLSAYSDANARDGDHTM